MKSKDDKSEDGSDQERKYKIQCPASCAVFIAVVASQY